MINFYKKSTIIITFLTVCFIFFSCVTIIAQEKHKIGGKIIGTDKEQHQIIIGDTEGHVFKIMKSEGTNTSTGKDKFMDAATVNNNNFSDVIRGNGHHQGYIVMSKDGNTAEAKWEGKVTNTMVNNNPQISFKGKFTYTKGSGKFENIKGGGTYKGQYTSANGYYTNWEGEYYIKKKK